MPQFGTFMTFLGTSTYNHTFLISFQSCIPLYFALVLHHLVTFLFVDFSLKERVTWPPIQYPPLHTLLYEVAKNMKIMTTFCLANFQHQLPSSLP